MNNVASEMEHLNKLARQDPGKRFTRLWENITHPLWLSHACEQIRRNRGSETPGVDGQTAWDVDMSLIANLAKGLTDGSYRPTPVRRVHIPKANGKTRPLGIPTIKDRIVQQAIRMALEPIFEADFKSCSHGFRQGRSSQTALRDVARGYPSTSWIIEGDIVGFYDNIPHDLLLEQIRRRIADERKNVPYYARERKHPGKMKYVRYADDTLILVYGTKQDAVEIKQKVADKRARMGLTLSEEKTKLTHWDEPVRFLGYEIRGIARERGVGIRARLAIPREKTRKIRGDIERVCEYHQIPEPDLLTHVSAQYTGFCNYYNYATAPQKAFSTLSSKTWWATAHYLARKHRCSIKQMLTRARKAGRYAEVTRGSRKRPTFREFVGKREVILDLFAPKTGKLQGLLKPQDWKVDLLPVNLGNWQSGRSLATRLEAMDRSGGMCERCHINPVAEVHHTAALRQKRTRVARVMSDKSQRLTAVALCKPCHLESHGRRLRQPKEGSGQTWNAGCAERRSPSVGTAS